MDMESLQTFLEVEKTKSFTLSATKLFCTQAAISMRIKKLESDLGCSLFERRSRTLALTRNGELFLPYAKQMYNIWTSCKDRLTEQKLMANSELQIACAGSLGSYVIPSLIYLFRQKYPYVSIINNVQYTKNVVTAVAEDKVPLGIIAQTSHVKSNEMLICEPLMEDPLLIVAPPNHPWVQLPGVFLRELTTETLLLPGTSGSLVALLEQLGGFSFDPTRLAVSGNIESLKRSLLGGEGVAVMSEYAVRPELELGVLRSVPIQDKEKPYKYVYSLRRRGANPPLLAQMFLDFAVQAAIDGTLSTRSI